MDNFQQVVKFFRSGNSFLIIPHKRPDGDALGSALALHRIIKLLSKKCSIFIQEAIPESFKFLLSNEDLIIEDENMVKNFDIVITLDSSNVERSFLTPKIIQNSNLIINIDHHITNESYGDINLVLPDCSSTCEIILKLSKIGYLPLTPAIADSLLTGIFTDTAFFRNQNVTDSTFDAAAELIRFGADHNQLISRLLQNKTIEELKFHAETIMQAEFSLKNEVGWILIPKKLREKYKLSNYKQIWGTGVIGFLNNLSHIKASFYFIEVGPEEVVVEFRSKAPYDVSIIAKELGGGGHALASGCTILKPLQEAKKLVLDYFFKNYELA
ncbi:MAG: DHH family phosphoesterase [Candidatus Muiribacteriota bacterium]